MHVQRSIKWVYSKTPCVLFCVSVGMMVSTRAAIGRARALRCVRGQHRSGTKCRSYDRATGTTCLRIKSWLVQTLISVCMMVSKLVWWLMEWVCRRLWAFYPPTMKFLYYPHVDPVEVAMVLNPSRMPHWGRFVTFSIWLQGYVPRLVDRVRVYSTVLHRQPRFIPCIYGLYGRWLRATLWQNVANASRRRRNRMFSTPIPNPCTRGIGRVASICPCAEVESSSST